MVKKVLKVVVNYKPLRDILSNIKILPFMPRIIKINKIILIIYTVFFPKDNNYKIRGVGKFIDKKRNKTIFLGQNGRLENVEWLPGMNIKCYWYPIHIHLRALIKNNIELIDLVDCYPIKSFKNKYPEKYIHHSKYPLWTIYVCKKK